MSGTVRAAARRGARRWWTAVAGATSAVVAALAVLHPGAPVAQVDLHDGGVWVTSATALTLARYNTQVEELNAGLVAASPDADVLQQAGDVLLLEPGRVAVVDPASVTVAAQATVPAGAEVSLGGGVVSVTDPRRGAVWARTTATLGTLTTSAQPPDLELGRGGLAVTTQDGLVLGAHADGTLHRGEVTAAGARVEGAGALAEPPSTALDAVTAVGRELVALAGSRLHTGTATVDLTAYGTEPVLQQPGPASDHVLVATRSALLEVPLGGGPVTAHRTGGDGRPASPVRVGACGHGAWASATGSSMLLCDGDDAVVTDLEGVAVGDSLVFRVNRDVVVLNDVLDGRLWVPTEDPRLREPNWQDIAPHIEGEQVGTAAGTPESTRAVREECTAQSAPLSAVDDAYGVRAGRTTTLSVIDNDASSDCGILAISEHDPVPDSFGTLVAVDGGRSLQLTTTPEATGTVRVTYTVTDGRGTTVPSTATVTLTVHPDSQDAAPVQVRPSAMVVEQGASATYDVRPDFRDPDGDHLVLTGAQASAGGAARARPDGLVTFRSDGSALGRQEVRLTVSDGTHTVEGTLAVDIRAAGSLPPVVDPVHAVTSVDQPVVVRPLESVRSASREPVRLAGVEEVPGATLVSDLDAGTFTFTAPRAGTYYVPFVVTAAPQQATGIARVDVREPREEAAPPVAVLDVALLPPGGEVTVDPLANDVDPAGGVLVLQSVQTPHGSGLGVATVHHELIRITSDRTLVTPVTLTYTVSNGAASATGQVLVQPLPRGAGEQPPVVPDATASVRTGGLVTIPVLDGAYDPDGGPLTLVPELAEPLGPGQGLLFVSGDALRYQAPDTPGVVRATFAVRDPAGTVTAATVTVTVHSSQAATKAPPRPRPLTARAVEAGTVRIPVPLTGIDPDGDGVRLLGPADAPRKGRITTVGPDWLEYEALPGELGTDTFSYAVEDWVGQRAVATVQVGIAPRGAAPAQVLSRNDDVTVRPGRTVEVRVLANDVDSDGGELSLDPDLRPADGVVARAVGSRVVVETPNEAAQLSVAYVARTSRGGQGTAVLTVHVSPDAPIAPPVARDVVVPATETIGRTSVRVDVLSVADNPSGPLSDVRVGVHPSASDAATVAGDGAVVVTLLDRTQTVPYSLTSTDRDAGASTYAFITVPALGDFPPVLRPRAPALRVVAGETLRIPLEEQVQVAPGRTPRIADVKAVSATKADGAPLVADSRTLVYTAHRGYAGPASISVEVTDGEDGDPAARRRVLTLPITVLAAEEHPPTFTAPVLDVGPGETVRVDLTAFTSAPVETTGATDRYVYRLTSPAPEGFRASLSGSALVVQADADLARGTAAGLSVAIDYGGGSVPGHLDLRVVASSRPLARVLDHGVPDGAQGRPTTVAVLDGAYNPFPGSPLTLVAAVVETPGAGTATVAGSAVVVRPAAGFVGTMVTRYRVRDVTGDPAREVEARVTVVVRGRPAAPTAPRVVEVLDRAVVLAWDAPAANGDPVTGYTVTTRPGDVRADCASTTCTVTGLANGTEHTFTVTATNAVGTSDPSPASAPARPDAGPLAPAAPQVVAGDGRLDVRWTAPDNPGSPIRGYDVELSPAPAAGPATVRTTATTHAFTGLTNGTGYTVRVRAVNEAPTPGAWSTPSAPARPAGLPGAPGAVTVTSGHTGTRTVTVSWQPPAGDGGDPVTGYRVVVDGGQELLVGADRHTTTFETDLGRRFEVAVQARNTVGWSPAAVSSGEVWGTPAAVTGLTATDVSGDGAAFGEGRLRLRWSRPATSGVDGQAVGRYVVLVDGRHTATVEDGRSTVEHVVGGLAGGHHSVEVVPVNVRDVTGPVVAVPAAVATVAQGVTFAPAEVVAGRVTFRWSAGGDGGTPVTGYRYLVEREGRADVTGTQVGTALAVPVPGAEPLTVRITVWALNARGESVPVTQEVIGRPAEPEPEPDPDPEPEPEPGASRLPDPGPGPEPDPEPEP